MNNELEAKKKRSELEISEKSRAYLKETGNWAYFFSILGFIFIGLLFIGSLVVSVMFSFLDNENLPAISGLTFGIVYIIFSIILFFPILYLYRFSTNMKSALENSESLNLEIAFKNIRSHYKFVGYYIIIMILIYVIAAVIMLFSGMLISFWQ